MVTVLQDDSLARGIEGAGSSLAQALGAKATEKRQQQKQSQYGTILSDTLGGLSENPSLSQILNALTSASSQGVPIDYLKPYFSLYEPLIKQGVKTESDANFLRQIGILPPAPTAQASSQNQPILGETAEIKETITPPSQNAISNWTEDQLVLAQASNIPALQKISEAELKKRKLDHQRFIEDRKYHSEGVKEAEKKVSNLRTSLPKKKLALALSNDAINSNEVGAFSLNNIAERLNIPELKTAKGAQLLAAAKENLISNLARVSAKAQNQWLEQRLATQFPAIGQSEEANKTIQTILEGELELDEAYLKNYDELSKKDEEENKFVKRDIERRVSEKTSPIEEEILKKTSFKIRQIFEQEKGISWLEKNALTKVPKGTVLTPQMAKILSSKYDGDYKKAIENAKKLGYSIPTRGEIESWQ